MNRENIISMLEDGFCNNIEECKSCRLNRIAECRRKSWDELTDETLLKCYVMAVNLNDYDLSRLRDTKEMINHPAHYSGKNECIDVIKAMLTGEEFAGFLKGNIIKYRFRSDRKNGEEDIRKAEWYEDKLIETRKE